jgi:hypothetical protein
LSTNEIRITRENAHEFGLTNLDAGVDVYLPVGSPEQKRYRLPFADFDVRVVTRLHTTDMGLSIVWTYVGDDPQFAEWKGKMVRKDGMTNIFRGLEVNSGLGVVG